MCCQSALGETVELVAAAAAEVGGDSAAAAAADKVEAAHQFALICLWGFLGAFGLNVGGGRAGGSSDAKSEG